MKILVVEDDQSIRSFLKKNLEAECHAVDVAIDGREGTTLANLNTYDLIILDNLMPYRTGLELCADLRQRGNTTPILILSVQSTAADKVKILDSGADDYLTKPFSLAELLARVRALLRRPPHICDEILSCGDITLDLRKHAVSKDGTIVTLTRKEFMLLAYLMQNKGTVLSRGMIMEHVWDINADPFSNTIETHIASLRKKIWGATTNNSPIHTISGCGYRFGAVDIRS